jgi:hypothetical protein
MATVPNRLLRPDLMSEFPALAGDSKHANLMNGNSRISAIFRGRAKNNHRIACLLRIPTKPARHSNMKPATHSEMKPAGLNRNPQLGNKVKRLRALTYDSAPYRSNRLLEQEREARNASPESALAGEGGIPDNPSPPIAPH